MNIDLSRFGLGKKKCIVDKVLSKDAIVASKIIDKLWISIDRSIENEGDATSKMWRSLLLTDATKNGIKEWIVNRDDIIKEFLDGVQQDMKER